MASYLASYWMQDIFASFWIEIGGTSRGCVWWISIGIKGLSDFKQMTQLTIAATSLLLLAQVQAFELRPTFAVASRHALHMVPPKGPAGSFFHQIPDESDEGEGSPARSSDDINDEVVELLRQRRKPARASNPSTINGIPTEKTIGFGKNAVQKKSSKPFVAIGPPDPTINSPTKPEFDDQGYTLYTDGRTGKKSRVFEALVEYPCDFTMKIVGMNEGSFVEEIVAVVADACDEDPGKISYRTKAMGKWASVTVQAPVKSSEMLYALYEILDRDPRVKFKF